MNNVLYYNDVDGRITGWGQMEENSILHSSIPVMVVSDPMPYAESTHYIQGTNLLTRPESPVVLQGNTLLNVPVGAEVWVNNNVYTATDSTVELSFAYPGTYKVKVVSFPQRDWSTEITV